MGDESREWRAEFAGVLAHPAENLVWVVPDGAGWALPRARVARRLWIDEPGPVSGALGAALGHPVRAYRYIAFREDREARREAGIYALEGVDPPGPLPARGRWIGPGDLDTLAARPDERAAVAAYFADVASGLEATRRPPWARPGWFAGAAAWIAASLAGRGEALVAPVEQVRSWSLSCVLRARTAAGAVYFKAATETDFFVNEPAVMAALAARYPGQIPAPLAVDAARRWMLLDDFGPPLGWAAPLAAQEALFRAHARLQIATARQPAWLLAIGCIDRRLDRLAAQIDPLLADLDGLVGLDAGEIARLRALAPGLKARCAALSACALPATLVHGDLHGGNAALRAGVPLVFDWTDACLAHPFFDLMTLLHQDEDAAATLRDAYLAEWSDFAPPARLREAWALARPLCALHQAVSYRAIMATLDARTRHENAGDGADWLRRLLALLPDDPGEGRV